MKRLYRSKSDAMIAGICSGLAKYLEVDPTVIRLAFVLLLVLAFGRLLGLFGHVDHHTHRARRRNGKRENRNQNLKHPSRWKRLNLLP